MTEHKTVGAGGRAGRGGMQQDRESTIPQTVPIPHTEGGCRHSAHMAGRNWGFWLQLAIFLPIQTILQPHNVVQPQNTTRILFVLTAPKVRRRGHRRNHSVRLRGQSISQPERGQCKSKFLIDTTNREEKMQSNTHQYTRNEGKHLGNSYRCITWLIVTGTRH